MTFRKVPPKTGGLNTTRRDGDFLADNARPCLSDRCPTFADSKDYLTAYRDAGNEKELRKRNGGTPSGTLTALRSLPWLLKRKRPGYLHGCGQTQVAAATYR